MAKNKKGNEEIEVLDFDMEEVSTKEEKTNIFKKLLNKWDNLSSRTKTIIIIAFVVVVVSLISIILFICFNKKDNANKKQIVVAKDNYRYEDGVLYFVVNHKDIGSYECKNKNKKLCYVAYETNDDDFDETKYEKESKIRSKIINNKYVFVFDNKSKNDEKITLYDIKKQKNIGTYKSLKTYNKLEKTVFVKNSEGNYGTLEFSKNKFKTKIPFEYDYLGIILENKNVSEDIIVASKDDAYKLIDHSAKELSSKVSGKITNYNSSYIKTKDATDKYALYDYKGEKKAEDLNYIDLLDEYYLAVDKDNKLKIYDYDNTKYLEEGITLYNNNYVKTVTKAKKDLVAYTYQMEDNNIVISVDNEGKTEETKINLLDGVASKNLKYVNYFNGVLYFYSDEAKTTLINSYKCNSANNLTKENMNLDTCFIASDNIEVTTDTAKTNGGLIPIINNRYVFIKDKDIINLVDLTDEKVIGTYLALNTSSDPTKNEVYLTNTADLNIIAKNKNNKYGVIKINNQGISSLYGFDYDLIEKLNQNLYVKKDNKYYLMDYNNNKLTYEYKYPIRNYNQQYVKVYNNDKYYIYDFDGNLVFEDGYKYVELYDTYVALVDDNNKLSVMDYKGNRIINAIIKLSSTMYYNPKDDFIPAFSIKKEDNKLTITCATSQETKQAKAKVFVYDLNTKERIN